MADKASVAVCTSSFLAAEKSAENPVKSIVLTGTGGYDKLKVKYGPYPTPKAGEVVVDVKACGLNFAELGVRQGLYDRPIKPPCVLGLEASGVVDSVGENVTEFKVCIATVLFFTLHNGTVQLSVLCIYPRYFDFTSTVLRLPDVDPVLTVTTTKSSPQTAAVLVHNYNFTTQIISCTLLKPEANV